MTNVATADGDDLQIDRGRALRCKGINGGVDFVERFGGGVNDFCVPGMGYTTNTLQLYPMKFPVPMRAAPTMSTSGSGWYILTGGASVAATSLAAHGTAVLAPRGWRDA
jgi:hypothetical protein